MNLRIISSFGLFMYIGLNAETLNGKELTMKLIIHGINKEGNLDRKYTCDGENTSPAIQWRDVTDKAKSLVLIVEDPDAPHGSFVHWVLFNIPVHLGEIPEGAQHVKGSVAGINDFGTIGYGGACPPHGDKPHRYIFKLFALNTELNLPAGSTKNKVETTMKHHIIAGAEIIATYKRD